MIEAFVGLHKPKEEMSMEGYTDPQRTLSQVQYLPETLRRCVANSVDRTAEALLGKPIADSIDLYGLLRETYAKRKHELQSIKWMPCLGVEAADFIPRDTFPGYNPDHIERWGATGFNPYDWGDEPPGGHPPEERHRIPWTTVSWAESREGSPTEQLHIPYAIAGDEK